MDNRELIPQIPGTVDERRAIIENRLRQRYPDLEIRVDLVGDVFSIVASCSVGSFREEASVHDSANHTVARLRSYFTDLADDYTAHLARAAVEGETPDERGERLDAARARVRVLVSHGRKNLNTNVVVRLDDLARILDAADVARDGATAAEETEWEAETDRSIAAHEESLTDEDYRA